MHVVECPPFIVTALGDDSSLDDGNTRKLIRRHVMLGRNRGKTHPNRQRPTKKNKSAKKPLEKTSSLTETGVETETGGLALPRQVGSDLLSMAWADSVDVSTMAVIMDFTKYTKKAIHPLDTYIDFPAKDIRWLEPLLSDAAWVHMMAFTSYTIMDGLRGTTTTTTITTGQDLHLGKSIRLLRERINNNNKNNDDMAMTTNSTVQVVVSLAMHAIMHGEFHEAKCHLLGLRQILLLRGGFGAFAPWPKLIIEILRADINLSLHTNNPPVLSQEWFSSRGRLPVPHTDVWSALVVFCEKINVAARDDDKKMSRDLLVDIMASSMYSLLLQSRENNNELVRLSLLVFGSGVFLQWQLGFPTKRPARVGLVAALKKCLEEEEEEEEEEEGGEGSYFVMWVLFMGLMAFSSVCDEDIVWFRYRLRRCVDLCGLSTWDEVRGVLTGFLWIDIVHDGLGRGVFESVFGDITEGVQLIVG
ncbi:hypothetical protein GGS20DRAFT_467163 [Poronia punctata]|nr:hypothetical protein GGS20DRAFT_467163 [Poronia punctata]